MIYRFTFRPHHHTIKEKISITISANIAANIVLINLNGQRTVNPYIKESEWSLFGHNTFFKHCSPTSRTTPRENKNSCTFLLISSMKYKYH